MRGRHWSGVWLLLAAATGWASAELCVHGRPLFRTSVGPAGTSGDPGAVLTAVAELALGLLLARVAGCSAVVSVALLLPHRRSDRPARRCHRVALALSPRVLRPVVVAALSAGTALLGAGSALAAPLTTTSASTAHPSSEASTVGSVPAPALPDAGWRAATSTPAEPPASGRSTADLPAPGWSPMQPATDARRPADVALVTPGARRHASDAIPRAARHGADPSADAVVVRRGDTLWSLAARQLGPDASDVRVAAQWHRWWHANRAAIGSDPDLLLPGTVLHAPVAIEVA